MRSGYKTLAITVTVHFFVMFALTYVLVDSWADVVLNVNRVYMAAMMVAPMVLLMLLFMRSMFPSTRLNATLYATFAAAFVMFFVFGRTQAFVGDRQFLRSMIPHHSSAIVMCERSSLHDAEIKELCRQIVDAQKREIDQMKQILQRI